MMSILYRLITVHVQSVQMFVGFRITVRQESRISEPMSVQRTTPQLLSCICLHPSRCPGIVCVTIGVSYARCVAPSMSCIQQCVCSRNVPLREYNSGCKVIPLPDLTQAHKPTNPVCTSITQPIPYSDVWPRVSHEPSKVTVRSSTLS